MAEPTPESIVRWAERREGAKPQGRAGHLSPEEKLAIRLAYLESGGQETYIALGRRFNVNRETVSACLKGPDFDALRAGVESEAKATAVQRLKAAVVPAADAWVRAIDEAADKGDHKPAKDLLMHTGTIEPLDEDGRGRGPLVLILARDTDGRQYYSGGVSGERYEVDEKTGESIGLPKSSGGAPVVCIGVPASAVKLGRVLQPPQEGRTNPGSGSSSDM